MGEVVAFDSLLVQCWCKHRYVRVAPALVRRGVTQSCGRKGCTPPDKAA